MKLPSITIIKAVIASALENFGFAKPKVILELYSTQCGYWGHYSVEIVTENLVVVG